MIAVWVPESLRDGIDISLARLGYLHPNVEFSYEPGSCNIQIELKETDLDEDELRKDVLYQLYREKINQDTLPIRRQLYGTS